MDCLYSFILDRPRSLDGPSGPLSSLRWGKGRGNPSRMCWHGRNYSRRLLFCLMLLLLLLLRTQNSEMMGLFLGQLWGLPTSSSYFLAVEALSYCASRSSIARAKPSHFHAVTSM